MKKKLLINGIIKLISAILSLGLLLFIPAGTFNYPGAIRFIVLLGLLMMIAGSWLLIYNPKLLEKRLNNKETETTQKQVILVSFIVFILSFILCGLDYRFKWTNVPIWLVVIGIIVFILTYVLFIELLKENEYISRVVEVQDNQKVISTGLYGIVRHPMYSIITFMFVSMPIIIGSFIGLIPLIALPIILIKRINNEEMVLIEGLEGYKEYTQKVKYRMIPFIY